MEIVRVNIDVNINFSWNFPQTTDFLRHPTIEGSLFLQTQVTTSESPDCKSIGYQSGHDWFTFVNILSGCRICCSFAIFPHLIYPNIVLYTRFTTLILLGDYFMVCVCKMARAVFVRLFVYLFVCCCCGQFTVASRINTVAPVSRYLYYLANEDVHGAFIYDVFKFRNSRAAVTPDDSHQLLLNQYSKTYVIRPPKRPPSLEKRPD